jgi:predicted HNH restriction endonuclease
MRGLAYSLAQERIQNSQFATERSFIDYLGAPDTVEQLVSSQEFSEPPPDEYVIEGGLALVIHLSRERDHFLVDQFKQCLCSFQCCVCGFDFEKTYGRLGKEFIEAHHVIPVSEGGQRETRITDLRPVCSNCHRMLHRGLGISIEDLRQLMRTTSTPELANADQTIARM